MVQVEKVDGRLSHAVDTLKEIGLLGEVEPQEVVDIAEQVGSKDMVRVAKTISYIRKRIIEKIGRIKAFKQVFPERCIVADDKGRGNEIYVNMRAKPKALGEPLSDVTIELKAKRLENSKLYEAILTILNTSLYVAYAIERFKVLDKALEIALDDDTSNRDRDRYMKLFLEETRKPEQKNGGINVNFNLSNNGKELDEIDAKLEKIANALDGKDAGSIIDVIAEG